MNKNNVAYVFPGQGSQTVGMGLELYNNYKSAREVFNEADEILKLPLSKLCFEGPEEELIKTINVQPAIVTVSTAFFKAAEEINNGKLPNPLFVAGHSVGEYTALITANVLRFKDALLLVRERGRLMYEAGIENPGGMIAVLGSNEETVKEICQISGTEISNINCPGQVVISGSKDSIEIFKSEAGKKGIRRLIPLKVSGAFHSRLMKSASEGLQKIINDFNFHPASIPIISNINAGELTEINDIKSELVNQVIHCVQWQKSVESMIEKGVNKFIEIGHGQVVSNLIKRINSNVSVCNLIDRIN